MEVSQLLSEHNYFSSVTEIPKRKYEDVVKYENITREDIVVQVKHRRLDSEVNTIEKERLENEVEWDIVQALAMIRVDSEQSLSEPEEDASEGIQVPTSTSETLASSAASQVTQKDGNHAVFVTKEETEQHVTDSHDCNRGSCEELAARLHGSTSSCEKADEDTSQEATCDGPNYLKKRKLHICAEVSSSLDSKKRLLSIEHVQDVRRCDQDKLLQMHVKLCDISLPPDRNERRGLTDESDVHVDT
ncbi:uncharacterized protein [Periplaneta americana]|uniref:uncharacterized protein isoform X3 n=1 Tax=Periplaneta americana TaxID=6978 RepID=UPI0037E8B40F